MSLVILFVVMVLLIGVSAFFSASEISMMSLNLYRLRHLVKKNHKQAQRVNQLLLQPDKLLSVVLIGNTLANILASMLATLIGQQLYGEMGIVLFTLLLTLIILIFSEMLPKTLAAINPQRIAFACVGPLISVKFLLSPLIYLVTSVTKAILRVFGVSLSRGPKESLSRDELRSVMNEAGGLLPLEHKSMLISLLDLESICVDDIMVPKAEITGLDIELPWPKLLEQLETAQHTRLPLFKGSLEHLVGIVHVRNVLNVILSEQLDLTALLDLADSPYYVPEGTPLNAQIINFQKMKRRSCIVVDEYGDLQGLVTMEDILEEIVGDFTTDIAALSKDVVLQPDGAMILDASITLRQLQRELGWQLPALGPRTLSGLIIEYLGYIPPADCCLVMAEYRIEILKVGDNMIKSVNMLKVKS